MSSRRDNHEIIVAAVVAGDSRAQVAGKAGISLRTLRRRLQDPGLLADIAAERAQIYSETLGQLSGLVSKALFKVEEVVDSGSDANGLVAARMIFDQVQNYRASLDEARIAALEARLGQLDDRLEDLS